MTELQRSPQDMEWFYNQLVTSLNLTYRPSQLEFMQNVYETFFQTPVVGFNESPTGSGKSFGYLIPSFVHLKNNLTEKVIISSKKLNLQEQLLKKDIPAIQQALINIDPEFEKVKIAVLKGRSNYVCGHRCFRENKKHFSAEQIVTIENWLKQSTGEKGDFLTLGFSYKDWKKIETRDSRECLKKACYYYKHEYCCHNRAKETAKDSNLLIINHYLLFTDIWKRDETENTPIPISHYTNVILDEAHLLEDIITQTFTYEFNYEMVSDLLSMLRSNFMITGNHDQQVFDSAKNISIYIKKLEGDEVPNSPQLNTLLVSCNNAILRYIEDMKEMAEGNVPTEAKIMIRSIIIRLKEYMDIFYMVMKRQDRKYVVWKENDTIKVTLIDYREILEKNFFNDDLCLNLVSATLSFHKQFYFSLKSLYIDRLLKIPKLLDKIYPPVFDKKNATFITPKNLKDYREEEYETQLLYIIKTLTTENKGSALLLFTSLKRMNSIYKGLKKEKLPFKLLIQSENNSKTELLENFKKDISSVLLGSYSFWEGIDVPGESLTLIIIDKLPFEIPTVVSKAISDQFGGFMYQCFKTTIKLKQGIGRLIRSEADKGKIIICDNRLHTTTWGKQIYDDLKL